MSTTKYQMRGKRASGRLLSWLTDLPDRVGALAGESVSDVVLQGGGIDIPTVDINYGAIFAAHGLTVVHYLRSDLGLHKTGSIVNAWDGQIGPTITELSAGVGIGTAGPGLSGFADFASNGTTQGGTYTLALPAPTSLVGVFDWHLVNVISCPTSTSALDSDGSFRLTTTCNTTVFSAFDGGAISANMSVSAWSCVETAFDNTVNSYLKFGANPAVTGNPGSIASGGSRSFLCTGSANFLATRVLAKIKCTGLLSNYVAAAASAKSAAQAQYGLSVT